MEKLTYVCLYLDYLESFQGLSDAAVGKLARAMLQYCNTGETSRLTGPAGILWPSIRSQMDRDMKKYQERCETNRINGAKGGRPPKNPSVISETEGFFEKPKKPKEKENDKDKDKEKEKEKENININNNIKINKNTNDTEKEKQSLLPSGGKTFKSPMAADLLEKWQTEREERLRAAINSR